MKQIRDTYKQLCVNLYQSQFFNKKLSSIYKFIFVCRDIERKNASKDMAKTKELFVKVFFTQ